MTSSAPRNTPFLCNHCFKWNTRYTTPVCSTCRTPKDPTCFPAPILFLRDQYVFTPNEWNEHATFPVMQREELRTLRDAYNSALAQEAKEYKASKTTKGKLKAFFKGGKSAKEEEDSIHDIYVARKKEIDARREEKSFLKGIQVDCPALKRKIDDRAWQIRFSVLVAFAKVDIPCLEKRITKLAGRLGVLLAFLQDLDSTSGGNEVVIELDDRRILTVHACIAELVSRNIEFESGDVAEVISQVDTTKGRIMPPNERWR